MITRNAADIDHYRPVIIKGTGHSFPSSTRCEFDPDPVTREMAVAHLELSAPFGVVVMCYGRGAKGGWGALTYTTKPESLPTTQRMQSKGMTLHVGYKRWRVTGEP